MDDKSDVENPYKNETNKFLFNDATIRRVFVRKVYALLTLQLLMTFGICAFFMFRNEIKDFLKVEGVFAEFFDKLNVEEVQLYLILGSLIGMIPVLCCFVCCQCARRKHPINLIILSCFTIFISIILGIGCIYLDRELIYAAAGITMMIFVSLTLFTFQTKYDFTRCGPYLLLVCVILLFSLCCAFVFPTRFAAILICGLVILLASFILVYHTQLILGSGKYAISPEEYVYAAFIIYMDTLRIFSYVLRFLRLLRLG